jgi:protein gp37
VTCAASTPAVRFLSLEPLLGPLPSLELDGHPLGHRRRRERSKAARPMDTEWVRYIRDRCAETDVRFFFKQAGSTLAREWSMTDPKGHTLHELPHEFQIREMPALAG